MKYVLTAVFATDVSNEQQRKLRNKGAYWLIPGKAKMSKAEWANAKSKVTVGREGKYAHVVFELPRADVKRAVESLSNSMSKVDGFKSVSYARV